MEDSLKSDKMQVEKKQFFFDLKENPRGRFLRITEDCNGRRDSIIVPAAGMEEFLAVIEEMVRFNTGPGDGGQRGEEESEPGGEPAASQGP
jgi:hypothetical protein